MREIYLGWDATQSAVPIGRRGESLATRLLIDCAQVAGQYSGATYTLLMQTPGEAIPFPCILAGGLNAEGQLVYTLTARETANAGDVYAVVHAMQGETVVKSTCFRLLVQESLGDPGPVPSTPPNWYQDMLDIAKRAEDAAKEAADVLEEILGLGGSSGAAVTANKLATAREIQVSGAVLGRVMFDGSRDVDIVTMTGDIVLTNEEIEEALQ